MSKVKKWYVFYCKSRAEKKANDELIKHGFESYLPLMQQDRVWSDRIKKVEVPMFNGYIFVKCHDFEIIKVLQFSQIVNTVKIGKEYAIIRQEEIDLLIKIQTEGLKVIIEPQLLKEGDKVEIAAGIMRGYQGILIEETSGDYIVIAIEGINQSLKIKVEKGLVRKN